MTALSLPGVPPTEFAGMRLDDPGPSVVVLRDAVATYRRATEDYYAARDLGDIVRASGADADVKWEALTNEGARVLLAWQRARAELRAAVTNRRAELARGRR